MLATLAICIVQTPASQERLIPKSNAKCTLHRHNCTLDSLAMLNKLILCHRMTRSRNRKILKNAASKTSIASSKRKSQRNSSESWYVTMLMHHHRCSCRHHQRADRMAKRTDDSRGDQLMHSPPPRRFKQTFHVHETNETPSMLEALPDLKWKVHLSASFGLRSSLVLIECGSGHA